MSGFLGGGGGGSGGFFQLESGSSPIKVSAMTAGANTSGAELVPAVQGGVNVRVTAAQLLHRANGNDGHPDGYTLNFYAGNGNPNVLAGGKGGNVRFVAGDATVVGSPFGGGDIYMYSGHSSYGAAGSYFLLKGSNSFANSGEIFMNPGPNAQCFFRGGDYIGGSSDDGGPIKLYAGSGYAGGQPGNVILKPGLNVSGGPPNGYVKFANIQNTTAAGAATLNNAPIAGNPQLWVIWFINGTKCYIPAWHA